MLVEMTMVRMILTFSFAETILQDWISLFSEVARRNTRMGSAKLFWNRRSHFAAEVDMAAGYFRF